jgi:hypothetical protein
MKKKSCLQSFTSDFNNKNLSTIRKNKVREIERYGIAAQGRSEAKAHYQGRRLCASVAIRAYCYECMSYFVDGKWDCGEALCPLYPWFPYKTNPPLTEPHRPRPAKKSDAPMCLYPTHAQKKPIESRCVS